MASSDVKAIGTLSKFAGALENAGGDFSMLSWLADDPELMKEIVEIGDRRLLDWLTPHTAKIVGEGNYNPAKFFSPGEHNGVTIAEVDGSIALIALDEQRGISNVTLSPYVVRKDSRRNLVYQEVHRLNRDLCSSVDHLRQALLDHRENPGRILGTDGEVNEFYILHHLRTREMYFPVRAIFLSDKGWKISLSRGMSSDDPMPTGTRLILSGKPIPGESPLFS